MDKPYFRVRKSFFFSKKYCVIERFYLDLENPSIDGILPQFLKFRFIFICQINLKSYVPHFP